MIKWVCFPHAYQVAIECLAKYLPADRSNLYIAIAIRDVPTVVGSGQYQLLFRNKLIF